MERGCQGCIKSACLYNFLIFSLHSLERILQNVQKTKTFVVYFANLAEQSWINPNTISQFKSKFLFYKQFLHTTSIVFIFDALRWVALATFKEIHRSKIPLCTNIFSNRNIFVQYSTFRENRKNT